MKNLIIFLLLSSSLNALAGELVCEAWFQEKGQSIEKEVMKVVSTTSNEKTYSTKFRGYDFKVNWNYELTTLYTFIEFEGSRILVTTARVPTENHPEAFTDLNIPMGPRLSVNCEVH